MLDMAQPQLASYYALFCSALVWLTAMVFILQVDSSNVWLRDGMDGTAYFPEEDGSFFLQGIDTFTSLDVEGLDFAPLDQQPGPSSSQAAADPRPVFKSVIASKKGPSHPVKVR